MMIGEWKKTIMLRLGHCLITMTKACVVLNGVMK
jgi:hypothetical protein